MPSHGLGNLLNRRKLLGAAALLSGAGLVDALAAGMSRGAAAGHAPSAASPGVRARPVAPILLKSEALQVEFDPQDGLPFQYRLGGSAIWGEDRGEPVSAILCRLQPRGYQTLPARPVAVIERQKLVQFTLQAMWEGRPAARFSVRYAIDRSALTVTLEDVREEPGFELIEVNLPNLATARDSDPAAWMAQGRDGGSFVRLASAKAFRYDDDENFGRVSTQLPIGMVGNGEVGCLMEVASFMDATETEIAAAGDRLHARTGTVQVYRVHGGRCYNMNDGGDAVCGDARTQNLLVGQQSRTRLDFFPIEISTAPWFAGAMLLRERLPRIPTPYFDDKLLYLIAGRNKVESAPRTTFAQSRQLVKDIARLTDCAPQVALISGWVYDGQDTGYPSEDKVNASLGSYDELMQLMADGRSVNANVTVNVNYDDAYRSSPQFDEAFLARRPDGAIWKSRPWDGEDSYIVGMAKYMAGGWGGKRIAATMARYRLRDAILIDAMSWFAIRNDWDSAHPASGYKNLADGKWAIIDQFRERGVHVASEMFRYPMLGKLALTVNGPDPRPCPFGGATIPLTSIVFRGSAIFGGSGDGELHVSRCLFWNQRPGLWYEHATDRRTITDFYYLVALPYNKLHALPAISYTEHGSVREIALERDSRIRIDADSASYSATLRGVAIAGGEATFCPVDQDRIAFYARHGGRLEYPVPEAWQPERITARCLTLEGRKPFPFALEDGKIVIQAEAQVPVMVYSSAAAIPSEEPLDRFGA